MKPVLKQDHRNFVLYLLLVKVPHTDAFKVVRYEAIRCLYQVRKKPLWCHVMFRPPSP